MNTVWAIVIGAIGSVVGALLMLAWKPFWARMRKPTPPSLADKVKIAASLEANRKAMERLEHMAAHPKDLFLYLIQLVFLDLMVFTGAAITFAFYFQNPNYGVSQPGAAGTVNPMALLAFGLLGIGLLLALLGIIEAARMSDKRIDQTRRNLQAEIDKEVQQLAQGPLVVHEGGVAPSKASTKDE